MKKKMMAVVAGALAFCTLSAGCEIHQSFGSLVPEEYGEWENYYIYHGNVRSKTTGEDGEYLVTEVQADGKTYTVQSCVDSAIIGDNVYMCLSLSGSGENGVEMKDGLVRYNVAEKKQETLMLDYTYQPEEGTTHVYHPYNIECVYENDGILLYGQRVTTALSEEGEEQTSYQNVYFTIHYDGTFKEEKPFLGYAYTRVGDEYFVKTETNAENSEVTILYTTFGMEEGVPICTFDNDEVYVEYEFINKNGVQGFLLKTYGLEDGQAVETYQGDKMQKLEFFNLETNTAFPLWTGNAYVEWIGIPNNEYFITYQYEKVNYTTKEGLFDSPVEQSAVIKQNCIVNQIVYSAERIGLDVKYTFEKNMGLQRAVGVNVATNQLYISMEWYDSAAGCNKGGCQSKQYRLDLAKGSIHKIKQEEWSNAQLVCKGEYAFVNGVSCGQKYAYYVEQIQLTSIASMPSYAYRLQRYNRDDKSSDVMQLWKGSSSDEREKYCQMMWKNNGGDLGDFIVRPF